MQTPLPTNTQTSPEDAPFTLTVNGATYTLIKGSERFSADNTVETYTYYQLLQKCYPTQFKSKYRKIICKNTDLYRLANAARFRVFRAVQLHFDPPPILPDYDQWIAAAHRITESMEENLTLPGQFSYAKWATRQDEPLAISLICHYGWARTPTKISIEETCIYKMRQTSEGIVIDIAAAHTFQERLNAACRSVLQEKLSNDRYQRKNDFGTLLHIGVSNFFFYKNRYVSASPSFNVMIKAHIQHYVEKVLGAERGQGTDIPYPEIEEPPNMMEDMIIDLKWSDFEFVTTTDAQYQQRKDNNQVTCLASVREKFNSFPQDTELTVAELGHPHRRVLIAAEKYGFLSRPKRGIVVLHYPKYDDEEDEEGGLF